jgi:hypothetical protein
MSKALLFFISFKLSFGRRKIIGGVWVCKIGLFPVSSLVGLEWGTTVWLMLASAN